jgi:acylphosphatase
MTPTTEASLIRVHVFISGRVQGVDFRHATKTRAEALGLTGWVRDLLDGRVEAIFEGEEQAVRQVIHWCRVGTPAASVDEVEVTFESVTEDFDRFHITW